MPLRLLTEAEARAEWSGDLIIARQQRIAFEDLGVMALKTIVVALVTLPLWRPLFHEMDFLPYWLALLLAVPGGFFAHFMGKEIEAARQPSAWLMAANRKRIWLHFRSFWHWKWPADEPTVLAIDLEDIDHLLPVRVMDGSRAQLAVVLREPLPGEMTEIILDENYRMLADKVGRTRIKHTPIAVESGAQSLRVRWGREVPTLREMGDKLRLNYQVEAPTRIDGIDDGIVSPRARLSEADYEQINALLREGDKRGALKLLRDLSGMDASEAREIIEGAGWQASENADEGTGNTDGEPR